MDLTQKIKNNFRKLGLPDPKDISGKSYLIFYKNRSFGIFAEGGIIENFFYIVSGDSFEICLFTNKNKFLSYDDINQEWRYGGKEKDKVILNISN